MTTYQIISGNTELEVFAYNEEQTETIILINGGPGIAFYLHDIANFLKPDLRVISFNQRGVANSKSGSNSQSIEDHLRDISNISKFFALSHFHLFGHAWGGLLAQFYTLRFPHHVKSLFLCNSFIGSGMHWKTMESEIIRYSFSNIGTLQTYYLQALLLLFQCGLHTDLALNTLMNRIQKLYFSLAATKYDCHHIPVLKNNARIYLANRHQMILDEAEFPKTSPLTPTLILTGAEDFIADHHWHLAERWPHAQIIKLPGSAHFPWLEAPEFFYKIMKAYYEVNMTY